MAGESGESHAEGSSNGVSGTLDADRAAFIAGITGDDASANDNKADEGKSESKADDDSDLDDDDDDEAAKVSDDDDDLDEDDEKGADKDEDADLDEEDESDKKADAETTKRMDQVRRTDKRLREQRDAQFKARESQIEKTIAEWQPRLEKAERLEKLIDRIRNPYEVGDVLLELGMSEDDAEAASQSIYARSKKFAADPKAKEAVAKLKGDRELRDEVARLRKAQEERDAREREASERTASEQRVVTFLDGAAKTVGEKTPLAKALITNNPDRARALMAEITGRLWDESGEMPSAKKVIIELERDRRREVRALGFDPKTRIAAVQADKAQGDKTQKAAAKKTDKAPSAKADDKPLTKEDFISGKFD